MIELLPLSRLQQTRFLCFKVLAISIINDKIMQEATCRIIYKIQPKGPFSIFNDGFKKFLSDGHNALAGQGSYRLKRKIQMEAGLS